MRTLFKNRISAGVILSESLRPFKQSNPIFLALPRGGVEIAYAVAKSLEVKFDVVISRKLSHPSNPEYGVGAISEDEIPFFNPDSEDYFQHLSQEMRNEIKNEILELRRRKVLYRSGENLKIPNDQLIILIDDGLATGVTASAAARFLRTFHPRKLILAVPVSPKKIPIFVQNSFDEIICPYQLDHFRGVGEWYENFHQLTDDQVLTYLGREPFFKQI